MKKKKKMKIILIGKDKFYSSLNGHGVSDKSYKHVTNAWKTFKIKSMKDLYLKDFHFHFRHNFHFKCDFKFKASVSESFKIELTYSFE